MYSTLKNSEIDVSRFSTITQTHQIDGRSDKYSFIPTSRVISALAEQGWKPVKIDQKRCNISDKEGFQKHLVRFRNESMLNTISEKGDIFPEIVLTNRHDGGSSFQIMAGLFRLVCLNGLCVADAVFNTHRIKHIGYTDEKVHDAVHHVIETLPLVRDKVKEFQAISLSNDERLAFGESALDLIYDDGVWTGEDQNRKIHPFEIPNKRNTALSLIKPIRNQDYDTNLWTTYNTVQEKMIKGRFGLRNDMGYQIKKARVVKSIDKDVKLNKALWTLSEKMVELKRL